MPQQRRARKRFGQNFLHDAHIIDAIVQHIAPQVGELIVEIGAGRGALTLPLLQQAPRMIVIELDRDLIPQLSEKCAAVGDVQVLAADALTVDFAKLAENQKIRVVGNLPYNIATPLLFHLMDFHQQIIDMHFMLQKEVADRLTAQPHTKQYGRLSVIMQFYCHMQALFDVPPDAFRPIPKVDSTVVYFKPKPIPPCDMHLVQPLQHIVKTAFRHRRKTLANNLKNLIDPDVMHAHHIDSQRRAETLSLAEFIQLSRTYLHHADEKK